MPLPIDDQETLLVDAVALLIETDDPSRLLRLVDEQGHFTGRRQSFLRSAAAALSDLRGDERIQHLTQLLAPKDAKVLVELMSQAETFKTRLERALDEVALGDGPAEEERRQIEVVQFGAPDVLPEVRPVEWLIPGILLARSYVSLAGKQKVASKTIFCTALAFSLTTGRAFLGIVPTRTAKCLFVQNDMPDGLFMDYTEKIRIGCVFPGCSIAWVRQKLNLADPIDQAALVEAIRETEAEVVILDSRVALWRPGPKTSANEASDVARFTRDFAIAKLRDELGCSVIVIQHIPRSGEVRSANSYEWDAAADQLWMLDRQPKGAIVLSVEGRHEPVEPVSFRIASEAIEGKEGIRLVPVETPPEERPRDRVVRFLQRHFVVSDEPLSKREIVKGAGGTEKENVAEVGELILSGALVKSPTKRGGHPTYVLSKAFRDTLKVDRIRANEGRVAESVAATEEGSDSTEEG
ncbi:MAG: AAA family ATPase [Planctomycetes bacterium]|nr:AAA family ATPase [Planctomycetota bacterium]